MPTYDISETEKIEVSIMEHLRKMSPEALSKLAASFGISDVSSAGDDGFEDIPKEKHNDDK